MKLDISLCVLMFACAVLHGAVIPKEKGNKASDDWKQMTVSLETENVLSIYDYGTTLNCDYSISTGEDLPVTVTWYRGYGPPFSTKVFSCNSFQKSTNTCVNQQIHDSQFAGRIWLGSGTPSLVVAPVGYNDNHIFWCEVSLEGDDLAENGEIGVDAKSVGMQVRYGSYEIPKLNFLSVSDENVLTNVGDTVTLECTCFGSSCHTVLWNKGPVNENEYDQVYEHLMMHSNTGPGMVVKNDQAYNDWVGRATLNGYSLVISNVKASDTGRYWCGVEDNQIGETATDAKSVVLEVNPFTCSGKTDGLYGDAEDCSSYYQCYGGKTYHQACAAGTVFNSDPAAIFVCDVPANVAPPCGTKVN